jgi:cysteine peptidase C11 family protein
MTQLSYQPPSLTTDPKQKWTVMVYMAGDNNLSDRCVDDLREMKMAGVSSNVTVKVQVDRSSAHQNRPARYTITGCPREGSDHLEGSLEGDREKWARPFNSGKKEPLIDFINWSMEDHPDDNYMLVLWGHASPLDAVPIPEAPPRTQRGFSRHKRRMSCESLASQRDDKAFFQICPDDFTHDGLTNIELRSALESVTERIKRPIDILGLDACLMSMVELTYDLRHCARFLIASESVIPATSWPYHWILAALAKDPGMSAENLCRKIVTKYIAYYADYDDVAVQLSACDLSKCEDLANAIKGLASTLTPPLHDEDLTLRNAILSAHFRAQPYYQEQYYDLYDFCYMLRESCSKEYEEVRSAAKVVMDVVRDEPAPFVLDSRYSPLEPYEAPDLQFSYGTSIYFPWASVSDRYQLLEFAKDSGWHEFLQVYTDLTAKEARDDRTPADAAVASNHI